MKIVSHYTGTGTHCFPLCWFWSQSWFRSRSRPVGLNHSASFTLHGNGTGNGTRSRIALPCSHCSGTGNRTGSGKYYMCIFTCPSRNHFRYRKMEKWVWNPLTIFPFPFPVPVPVQCEQHSIIFSNPFFPFPFPFPFPLPLPLPFPVPCSVNKP